MAKKNQTNWILVGVVVGFMIILIIGGTQGWFRSTTTIINVQNTTIIERLKNAPANPSCTASITPRTVYVGDEVRGTVNDGSNTHCDVYLGEGDDWRLVYEGITNSAGTITFVDVAETVGTFRFRVICGDCITNAVTLTVNPLPTGDNDGDGIPNETDPDDDNDGFPDVDEIGEGTDPFDPDSHPEIPTCNTQCISKGFVSGRGPFESGSYCIGTEVIEYLTGESGLICCCLPAGGGGDGGGTMTSTECHAWADSLGKQYWLSGIDNIDECEGWAWAGCQSIGKILLYYDFSEGCCVWSCE